MSGTAAADTLSGSSGIDYICALGGNDSINGGQGNDTILADAGDDTLEYAPPYDIAGDDVINGESGTWDYGYYRDVPTAVQVDLVNGTSTGGSGNDRISNVEGMIGSPAGDSIIGNGVGNLLLGEGG